MMRRAKVGWAIVAAAALAVGWAPATWAADRAPARAADRASAPAAGSIAAGGGGSIAARVQPQVARLEGCVAALEAGGFGSYARKLSAATDAISAWVTTHPGVTAEQVAALEALGEKFTKTAKTWAGGGRRAKADVLNEQASVLASVSRLLQPYVMVTPPAPKVAAGGAAATGRTLVVQVKSRPGGGDRMRVVFRDSGKEFASVGSLTADLAAAGDVVDGLVVVFEVSPEVKWSAVVAAVKPFIAAGVAEIRFVDLPLPRRGAKAPGADTSGAAPAGFPVTPAGPIPDVFRGER